MDAFFTWVVDYNVIMQIKLHDFATVIILGAKLTTHKVYSLGYIGL